MSPKKKRIFLKKIIKTYKEIDQPNIDFIYRNEEADMITELIQINILNENAFQLMSGNEYAQNVNYPLTENGNFT